MYNFNIKTVIDTDYHEIENIINCVYYKEGKHNNRYELPPTEERGSGNGETWEVNVKRRKLSTGENSCLEKVANGQWPTYCTRSLLQDLCNKNMIPEGTYMIDISW